MEIIELICGKDFTDREKAFQNKLSEIEEKYIDFFKDRGPKYKGDLHDRLHNHHMFYYDSYKIKFGFEEDSEVPYYIKNECLNAFLEIFKNNDD